MTQSTAQMRDDELAPRERPNNRRPFDGGDLDESDYSDIYDPRTPTAASQPVA